MGASSKCAHILALIDKCITREVQNKWLIDRREVTKEVTTEVLVQFQGVCIIQHEDLVNHCVV